MLLLRDVTGLALRLFWGLGLLALSGGGGILLGSVSFKACHGPLSRAEWAARGEQHCVAGDALPYGSSTHAWELVQPQRFRTPVPYHHKPGIVVWAIKD